MTLFSRYVLFGLILGFILPATPVYPQSDSIKIGVALSGGGAKGLAHIGFLQALQELGIEPDYVTGVSMGSIVGGMYACGYHPDVIAREFRKMDYNLLLSDNISENRVSFDEKPFFRSRLLPFSYSHGKLQSPGGLLEGQYITTMMEYYTWPVAMEKDFSKLPVPYQAIATNLQSVTPRLFTSGNLADVMRASMAVPLAFSPVEINDTLYVDGGVVRNMAVDELKDMGADIIIGSFTSVLLLDKESLKSLPNLTGQLMMFQGVKSSEAQFGDADVLVDYEFGELNGTDFHAYDTLINLGYQTTMAHREALEKIAERVDKKSRYRRRVPEINSVRIDSIAVTGNVIHSDEQILDYLGIRPGYSINPFLMKDKMEYLYGLFLFDKVNYELIEQDNRQTLVLKVIEKPRNWMNLSLHYDNHYDFGVNFDYIFRNPLLPKSRFSIDAYLSRNFRIKSTYTKYFGRMNKWSADLSVRFYNDKLPAYRVSNDYAQFRQWDFNSEFAFYRHLGSNAKIGLAAELEQVTLKPVVMQSGVWDKSNFSNFNLGFRYLHNNLDHYYFPTKGKEITLQISNVNLLRAHEEYYNDDLPGFSWENEENRFFRDYSLLFRSRIYLPMGSKVTLGWLMNTFFSFSNGVYNNDYVMVGGWEPHHPRALAFNGFYTHEFVVNNGFGTGIKLDYRVYSDWILSAVFDAYYLENRETSEFLPYLGAGLQIGYDFMLGPMRMGVMHGIYSEREVFDRTKFFVSIGYLLD